MIHSMTGYGRAVETIRDREITVELRSVNNRFLDCNVKMPRAFSYAEEAVKQAEVLGIAKSTMEDWLKKYSQSSHIEHIAHGKYRKFDFKTVS